MRGATYPPLVDFDAVIHVGVHPDRRDISFERRARRYGYNEADAAGKLAEVANEGAEGGRKVRGFAKEEWAVCNAGQGELLETIFDLDELAKTVEEKSGAKTSVSNDAGESSPPILDAAHLA